MLQLFYYHGIRTETEAGEKRSRTVQSSLKLVGDMHRSEIQEKIDLVQNRPMFGQWSVTAKNWLADNQFFYKDR